MSLYEKISILGPGAKYDTCGPRDLGNTTKIPGVYIAKMANGCSCRLFKVLQTNACKNNCKYCAFRKDRDTKREIATPDEMASAFMEVKRKRLVDGLFLSSGVTNDADTTMSRMLDTVHIVRKRYHYSGYVHLKIMPEASTSCIQEAIKVANRISLNIEVPTKVDLAYLSPEKDFHNGFLRTMSVVQDQIKKRRYQGGKVPSVTTQFIVGAGEEKDTDIVRSTHFLYESFGLKRVFFSAFRPVINTPLQDRPAASLTRQHRLYQADFLMRFYKFLPADVPVDDNGYLIEAEDPKMVWAKTHPEVFPININTADYWNLIKVPGIGPMGARKIMRMRDRGVISNLNQLHGKRISLRKISTFVTT